MITNKEDILSRINKTNGEYVIVKNPAFVFPSEEYYILAERNPILSEIKGVMMDMDGTTTTTEELCIFSLETMVRRNSGLLSKEQWQGLDHQTDYPNIIGNSTTRHVEYLIETYKSKINPELVKEAFLKAALWTILYAHDNNRKAEVKQNLRKLNIESAIHDIQLGTPDFEIIKTYKHKIKQLQFQDIVSLSIDIYYEEYHRILNQLANNEADKVKQKVFDNVNVTKNLIDLMPGIPVIIPMLKGWLGTDITYFTDDLLNTLKQKGVRITNTNAETFRMNMIKLSVYFEKNPAKLGLVTSSIFYEANIVINEVIKVITNYLLRSELPVDKKRMLTDKFSNYHNVYDAFVTASDSNEIRLKPHRDLYSIALHQAGISPSDFDKVIGFEDSQSGTIAIRAAGIGCCIAVPFSQTAGHNLEAATDIAVNGIPEVLLLKNLYLNN